MSDVNPLGPMMHLKELEREAASLRNLAPQENRCAGLARRCWRLIEQMQRLSASLRSAALRIGLR